MTLDEKMLFNQLLFSHRHLWMVFQEYRYLHEHPDMDWETAHEIFFEESDEAYNSLAEFLREGKPIQDKLQTVLLQSELTQTEVLRELKGE